MMNILVFGKGVIGTIYAYSFSQAGFAVTHYVRPSRLQEMHRSLLSCWINALSEWCRLPISRASPAS